MVSLPPTWTEASPALSPATAPALRAGAQRQAIVQAESGNAQSQTLTNPDTPIPSESEAARLDTARNRVQQHLQQLVEADRATRQAQSAIAPSAVTPTPQPIPFPSPVVPSTPASQQTRTAAVPPIQKLQNTEKKPTPVSPAPMPAVPESVPAFPLQSQSAIPFVPESVGVAPTSLGSFCSIAPQSQTHSGFLASITQLSAGMANFLHIPIAPKDKPQNQPIDLRTLQGTPSTDCSSIGKLSFPLATDASVTSGFGWRMHPVLGTARFHSGIDFGATFGTIVRAAQAGTVIFAGDAGDGYGGKVVIQSQDNTQRTLYAHLSSVAVRPGERVGEGAAIGRVGSTGLSTGPHLHFETQVLSAAGEWQAVDPLGR